MDYVSFQKELQDMILNNPDWDIQKKNTDSIRMVLLLRIRGILNLYTAPILNTTKLNQVNSLVTIFPLKRTGIYAVSM